MRHIHLTAMRLPLILRVVAMYVLISVPLWSLTTLQAEQAATTQTLSTVKVHPKAPTPQLVAVQSGQPTAITIPRLGIELPVIEGTYDQTSDSWTLSDDKVQFAAMTSQPNDRAGNTFMYGHNTEAVFMPLSQLRSGDEVIIKTVNGLAFSYRLNAQSLVAPDDTTILNPTNGPSLTLMTCEGIFSEARRVAVFDFKEVL